MEFYNLDAIISVTKNYLNEKELDYLNRIVTMYLDYAEMQAQKGVAMRMKDWVEKLDATYLNEDKKDGNERLPRPSVSQ